MSAQTIFDHAPLGALIRFSDGTPKPPARFTKKLAIWESNNAVGRLTGKSAASQSGSHIMPATFALHMGDFGSNGVVILTVTRSFTVTTRLAFEIIEYPKSGMVRVTTAYQGAIELRHLASDMAAAQRWAENNRYSDMRFDVVTQAEVSRFTAMGRAA